MPLQNKLEGLPVVSSKSGLNLGRVFNSRGGSLYAVPYIVLCIIAKLISLELKTRPKPILSFLSYPVLDLRPGMT
jgi:hypothetical protein